MKSPSRLRPHLGLASVLAAVALFPVSQSHLDGRSRLVAIEPLAAMNGAMCEMPVGAMSRHAIATLRQQQAEGPRRQLAGFVLEGRGVARAGHAIAREGAEVGRVTSGAPSPTLGKSIGLGYVPPALAAAGSRFDVVIREQAVAARVVSTPFVGKG